MASSFLNRPELPLGLRNNNPGNLRPLSKGTWVGEIEADRKNNFSRFKDISFGIRAMATDLIGDIAKDGMNTLRKLIYSYAPPSENNTEAYLRSVSQATGLAPDARIPMNTETIKKIMRAQMNVELGAKYSKMITDADIAAGVGMITPSFAKLINLVKTNPGSTTAIIVGFFFSFM